ncbi:ABC transporter ATP-binding protein [Pseudonocardia endophytica]|uniref:ATP-binding cassette subfamily B protein n=1 Tax=Pseudonocardia endophytica TaxID=401976 RepID=A0A4R1HPV0_PSEEN|nr:ABC transporter ATP-binding protein [Pseudonocardia endophytica]TCK24597.1 ATP-binding cassette subfamily B protein [Pseudonocardia endophytica]
MTGTLGALLRPVRWPIAAVVALSGIAAVLGVVPLVAVVEAGRAVVVDGPVDPAALWTPVLVAVAALVARAVLVPVSSLVAHLADVRLGADLRRRVVDRLGRVPLSWFGTANSARVKAAVQDDVGALHHLVGHAVHEVTTAVVVPVTVVAWLLTEDPLMTVVTVLPAVAGALAMRAASRGTGERLVEFGGAMTALDAVVVEFVRGIREVRAAHPDGGYPTYRTATRRFGAAHREWGRATSRASAALELATSPVTVIVVTAGAGTALVASGWLAGGADVLPFVVLGLAIPTPVLAVGFGWQSLLAARGAAGRIAAVLGEPELPVPDDGARPDGSRVVFDGVGVDHGEHTALRAVSLTLEPGSVTALVGPSGAGKSTLARLLARFDDPVRGAVTIGGTDLRAMDRATLYGQVAFVFQDTGLIGMSVRDNVALGRPSATDDDVRSALVAARVLDVVDALPRGTDSVIGEDATLSGGERQRVTIARALLADRPVLVLDEATSATDLENEAEIGEALRTLVAGRTVLVIAHRLHTVIGADRIVVLDDGRVVESGTHDELLDTGDLYPALWAADTRDTVDAGRPS